MPQIPTFQRSTQLRTGRGPSLGAVSAVTEAVGQLAGQVSRQANIAVQRQKDADDAAFVTESTNSLLRSESERLADTETRGVDVDMSTLQTEFNERVGALAENAPSEDARNELLSQADNAFSRKFFPSYSRHQSGRNVQKRVQSFESGIDDIQSEVLTGRTSVAEAVARTESALTGLEETSGGVIDIDKARISAFNEITTNALGGRINRGDGLNVINEIKEGKWDKFTDSQTLARVLSAAERDIKQRDAATKQQFAKGFDDYVAFLSSGQDDEALAERFSPENINAVFGEKGPDLSESVSDARSFGQSMNEVKTAAPDELRTIVDQAKPTSGKDFRRESRQFGILNNAIRARNKAISEDPSAYVMQNSNIAQQGFAEFQEAFNSGDPEATADAAKDYASIQRSVQEDLGVHPQGVQLLPKQFEDSLAKQLNDFSQGGENVALQIDSLSNAFGDEWKTVQRQLQQNKQMGSGLRVMSGMDFGPEMIRLGEALAIPQKQYKEFIGDDDFKAITQDTIGELEEFQDTLRGQPGAEAAFIQHKTAIETLSMKYMADGVFDSTGDAIEQAKVDVLDSRFSFVDTYRVPIKFSSDNVEDNVLGVIDQIQAGEFDLFIPDSDVIENDEDRREVYLSALRPTPITSPNGDGILFTDQNGNAIFDATGDPLIIPFDQLDQSAPAGSGLFESGSVGR